ncbi:hypothetical protein EI546_07720 [Aequorivita sp. H23M31]|uniref:Uncharacterized protein n=1 Tax=Aequorivita ciconiae TaxID=2494375 RepID=A0A410G2Z5_9FLAO|nr:hypothetical protein [Aequorivita sp. H23M31]QAA81619.1 hypothetical protein EI546_07720 [Aequorivita sp. H23M31]
MFKKIVGHKGFWKSVISLALAFAILFGLIKWAIEGFATAFFTERDPLVFILGLLLAGLVYGFFVTFGKFRAKIKENESRR